MIVLEMHPAPRDTSLNVDISSIATHAVFNAPYFDCKIFYIYFFFSHLSFGNFRASPCRAISQIDRPQRIIKHSTYCIDTRAKLLIYWDANTPSGDGREDRHQHSKIYMYIYMRVLC